MSMFKLTMLSLENNMETVFAGWRTSLSALKLYINLQNSLLAKKKKLSIFDLLARRIVSSANRKEYSWTRRNVINVNEEQQGPRVEPGETLRMIFYQIAGITVTNCFRSERSFLNQLSSVPWSPTLLSFFKIIRQSTMSNPFLRLQMIAKAFSLLLYEVVIN